MNDCKSRYLNDPIFHCVVDHMRSIIRSATLTPSEVREAAMTACVIEEMYNPRPPFSTSDEELGRLRQVWRDEPDAGAMKTYGAGGRDGSKNP